MDRSVFSGNYIDRLGELRTQPEKLKQALEQTGTRFLPVCPGKGLVRDNGIALLTHDEIKPFMGTPERCTFLGAIDGCSIFCISIADADAPEFGPPARFVELREVLSHLPADDAALIAYANAMVTWQHRHRYCGVCGTRNKLREAGFVMECTGPDCGHRSFPRLDPAIIVLVQHDNLCLLGRQVTWPENRFSTIAGFVEPGESLEDAVRREVREETNVDVATCRYLGSQPWPFPAAIMIGFHADAATTAITCNDGELAEARWVSRDEIRVREVLLPPTISIAYRLIEEWFDQHDGPSLASLNLSSPPLQMPRPLNVDNP